MSVGWETISGSAVKASLTSNVPPQGIMDALNSFVDLVIPISSILSDSITGVITEYDGKRQFANPAVGGKEGYAPAKK